MLYFIPFKWALFMSIIIFNSVKADPLVLGFTKSMPAPNRVADFLSNRAAGLAREERFLAEKLGVSDKKSSDDDIDDNEARAGKDNDHNTASTSTISSKNNIYGVRNYLWSYLITVGVGHPKQEFKLILDTGSSVLWVPSSKCSNTTCPGSSSVSLFDTSASSSYHREEGNIFDLSYGSGGCSGESGEDSIFIGDTEIKQQKFGVADKVSEDLLTDGVNGILGFGPGITGQKFNSKGEKWSTPMQHLLDNGNIKSNMFSIYFDNVDTKDGLETANGRLVLGGLPPHEYYTGEIQWANLFSEGKYKYYWAIKSEGMKVNNKRISGNLRGIVDTGTTMTILAPEFGKRVISALKIVKYDQMNSLYYVDCKKISSLPTLTFLLNGNIELSLTPEQYTAPSWQTSFWLVEDNQCPLYISTDVVTEFDFILGQKFLEYHVAAHDIDNKRIGLASRIHNKAAE
ncbi:unnamed protein product [Absidia cylindrospora]